MSVRSMSVLSLLVLAACSGGDDTDDTTAGGETLDEVLNAEMVSQPVKLSEQDMTNYLATMEEFKTMGEKWDGRRAGNADQAVAMGTALAANAEAMAILRKHDFESVTEFARVSSSIMSAAAAGMMASQQSKMAQANAAMEKMKSSMTPEQYEAMRKAQGVSTDMVRNQPEGNVELVGRYMSRLQEIGTRDN